MRRTERGYVRPQHGRRGGHGEVATATAGTRPSPGIASTRRGSCDRDSGRLQGCAPPQAGIKPWDSAPAEFHLASKRAAAVAAAKPTPLGICPRRRRGIRAAGFRSCGIPLADQKKAHRVGLASVQLTRSTFAEATAGRESLQPSALRARCTRKPTSAFGRRQALVRENVSQIATIVFIPPFAREIWSTQKRTEGGGSVVRPPNRPPPKRLPVGGPSTSGAPSSVHTGHYGPVVAPSSGNRSRKLARCGLFFSHSISLRLDACALERKGPWIRRAGCAFVHLPG